MPFVIIFLILSVCELSIFQISYFNNILFASMNEVKLGNVGPEAIVWISSPITSEIARVKKVVDEGENRISFPPFTCERCIRTTFISWIAAPDESNECVTYLLSANVIPFTGRDKRADPPPDNSTKTRSLVLARRRMLAILSVPLILLASGNGCPASIT